MPSPDDRLVEVVALEAAEPPLVICRMQRDITDWDRPLHTSVVWTLPAGEYIVVACVTGKARGRCSEQAVTVR